MISSVWPSWYRSLVVPPAIADVLMPRGARLDAVSFDGWLVGRANEAGRPRGTGVVAVVLVGEIFRFHFCNGLGLLA